MIGYVVLKKYPLLSLYLLAAALFLPFIGKAVHVDDANFIRLAEGARADIWRPHAIEINWQGTMEPAFDVLSNPPGIGWWLALASDGPIWLMHLMMFPWVLLAIWGMRQLGVELLGSGKLAALLLISSPIFVLSAQSLTPDMPLLACVVAGLGGFLSSKRGSGYWWALLVGAGVLFKYSGICFIPLLILVGVQRRRVKETLLVFAPLLALALHDILAYGQVHIVAMTAFQSVSESPRELIRKGIASVAMLGGVGLLPILSLSKRAVPFAVVGGVLGLVAGEVSQLSVGQTAITTLFTTAGAIAFSTLRLEDHKTRLLAAWAVGGLVFLLTLRFSAARYWLPFLPAFLLAAIHQTQRLNRSAIWAKIAVGVSVSLSVGLAIDDMAMAQSHRQAAFIVSNQGRGSFSGHWGWQHYLEDVGWTPVEEGGETRFIHAVAENPWPQPPSPNICLELVDGLTIPDIWPGPRLHSRSAAANYHSFIIAGEVPKETYSPWWFSDEPYERVAIYNRCD
jgi:4-amino-4-deoxy-L-arabinose transferase-like glycosyltransferase